MKHFVPHRYQFKAIYLGIKAKFLALFLDPGMGKTSIILRIFVSLMKLEQTKGMLVVAPLRPCYTVWPKELTKWSFSSHLKLRILHGEDKLQELNSPADIYVINPEGLKWLFTVALKGKRNYPFDILVIDESGKFKNPDSARLKILKPRLKKFTRRYILNGTPAPNSVMDLWGQFLIVDQGKTFGRKITHFRNQYFVKTGYMGKKYKIADNDCRESVYERAAKMCLVMESKDYLDMPPIVFSKIIVQLPSKARIYYDEVEEELFTEIDDDEIEISNKAVAYMSCRQIANGGLYHPTPEGEKPIPTKRRPWYDLHREKDKALVDLVDELQGKPLIVAYEFHHDLLRIKECLKKAFKLKVPHIGSGVSTAEGEKIENDWNAGKIRVLAGHPSSISHGLNLQESGGDIFWYSLTDNLENYLQYIQRIYRQGFKGSCVRIHHCISENTVDEAMMLRLGDKAKNQTDLKDALKEYREGRR